VVPVPLHVSRRRKKGFNHATIIGRALTQDLGLNIDERSLIRVKNTERHRAGMDAHDRMKSVEGAFEVARPRLIEGAAVLLVDDVFTTGSTVSSAATVLLKAGAAKVDVLTLARVIQRTRTSRSGTHST
jgi:ComF family protein